MSHLVIYDSDGTDHFERFVAIDEAVTLIERLRNDGDDSARLYRLEEVPLEVKAYYRVELGSSAPPAVPVPHEPSQAARAAAMAPGEPTDPAEPEPLAVEADAEPEPIEDDQPSVIDEAPPPNYAEFAASSSLGGARRGLFGR